MKGEFVIVAGGSLRSRKAGSTGEHDSALVFARAFECNFKISFALKARKLLAPFDQENVILAHQIVEPERFEFALCVDAVKIYVIERGLWTAVFVDERERGAGDVVFGCGVECLGNSFDQGGLASAEITSEQNDLWRGKHLRQVTTERDRFLGRGRCELANIAGAHHRAV